MSFEELDIKPQFTERLQVSCSYEQTSVYPTEPTEDQLKIVRKSIKPRVFA